MQCEICGRYVGKGKRVRVEGSVVITCDGCSGYGEVIGEAERVEKKEVEVEAEPLRRDIRFEIESAGLVDDYSRLIREARERKGMKQKDLAASINEPISLIHRIESGRLKPSNIITRKIQSKLGIKLFEESGNSGDDEIKMDSHKELTLGDLVVVRKRSK